MTVKECEKALGRKLSSSEGDMYWLYMVVCKGRYELSINPKTNVLETKLIENVIRK